MKRSFYITSLVATSLLAGCVRRDNDSPEEVGETSQSVSSYAPTDPLGPILSSTPGRAPGFSTAGLDAVQTAVLANAPLRRRLDGGPNSVHFENLQLQAAAPTDTQIAYWTTGAIKLAGFAPPAPIFVTSYRTTPTDDGLGHTIPSFRV